MVLRQSIMPVAGRIRPKTSSSGILSAKRNKAVKVSKFTRMLVPKPKKAFQSPGVHSLGFAVVIMFLTKIEQRHIVGDLMQERQGSWSNPTPSRKYHLAP